MVANIDHVIIPQLCQGAGGGDDDVLLVAVTKELEAGAVQEAAQTLMLDKYEVNELKFDFTDARTQAPSCLQEIT